MSNWVPSVLLTPISILSKSMNTASLSRVSGKCFLSSLSHLSGGMTSSVPPHRGNRAQQRGALACSGGDRIHRRRARGIDGCTRSGVASVIVASVHQYPRRPRTAGAARTVDCAAGAPPRRAVRQGRRRVARAAAIQHQIIPEPRGSAGIESGWGIFGPEPQPFWGRPEGRVFANRYFVTRACIRNADALRESACAAPSAASALSLARGARPRRARTGLRPVATNGGSESE